MNSTHDSESAIVLMLYKLTQDAYVSVFGNGSEKLSNRDIDRIRSCYNTLRTIVKELDSSSRSSESHIY